MAAVKNSVSASKDALAAIFGKGSDEAQVSTEATPDTPAKDATPSSDATQLDPAPAAELPKKKASHMESVMGTKENPIPPREPTPTPEEVKAEEIRQEERQSRKEWPSTRAGQQERSVSPGTMDDGRHATTSGDKGQSYQPPGGIGKLKGKLFGH